MTAANRAGLRPPHCASLRHDAPTQAVPHRIEALEENDGLRTTIVVLRRELADKRNHVAKLKYLLCSRLHRTDELFSLLEQANRKLRDRPYIISGASER